ncbi:menaquinone biosynthesis protein [Salibacterium halotolerans]|uniref:Chorismate dehydratase n=1 Tax=Salibacterium halotolerans TaxID=1884432 RepID=A0A1I5Q5Z0_9BACI|nr:menaquinone biosynthesis protein [Salibacterium halotolerans]SFP41577.1 chorismate dehydratase [Salibacterium halotolerans]
MSIRIGEISYTNIIPAFHFLNKRKLESQGCLFYPKVPAQLNEGIKEGSIDAAGISSFAYGENAGNLELLPDLSVSSYGKVGSILFFSKKRMEELEGSSIALTSSSATSVHLLKVILAEFYGLKRIDYQTMQPDSETMKAEHDAFLLIGDDAIRESWNPDPSLYCYDLGELWYKHTGLPMTYAVFAVRNEASENEPDIIKSLFKAFHYSKALSLYSCFEQMIRDVQIEHGGSPDFWDNYFRGLHYDFREREKQGLLYYFKLLYKYDFFKTPVNHIQLWTAGNEVQYLF